MKSVWIPLLITASICRSAFAQADACAGAMSGLNRVKEQLTPTVSPNRLGVMYETLKAATRVCTDQPELLYYRSLIAERLGDKREVAYLQQKIKDLPAFQPSYANPLSAPPLAIAEAPPSRVGKKWALVVGINRFQDKTVPQLNYAVKDSTDFAKYLTDPNGGRFRPDRVKTLTDEKATLVGVREGLGWLRQNVQPEDLVVIYLSSHGSPRDIDPNGVSYIIMNDTKLGDSAELYATSLQMIDLVQQINREIRARRLVLLLDTCYSGDASAAGRVGGDVSRRGSAEGSRRLAPVWAATAAPPANSPADAAFSAALETIKMGTGRAVITASRANEESFENPSYHNGYFTYYLLDTLRKSADQPLGDIFPKVRDNVLSSVSRDHGGKTQTPSSEFSDNAATIVISVPEG